MKLALWKLSHVAVYVSTLLDTHSSQGRPELNPLLAQGGQFTAQSAAIKFGIVSGVLLGEYLLTRRHPDLVKPFTYGNFVIAGVTTGVAVRNLRLRADEH